MIRKSIFSAPAIFLRRSDDPVTAVGAPLANATVEDVELMRRIVGAEMGVKASGGVRSADDARKMFKAGADRIGASASVAIVTARRARAATDEGRPGALPALGTRW